MKNAAECVPAHYVETEDGRTPEPRLRQSWSRLRKLQWNASLIMSEHPGVRLYVSKGKSWTNNRFNYGLFQISYNNGGKSAMDYNTAWELLNGIDLGLRIAALAASPADHHEPVSGDDQSARAGAWREFLDRLGGTRISATVGEIERQAFFAGWEAHESRSPAVQVNAAELKAVIDDMDEARAGGRIYTYGHIQARLRSLVPEAEEGLWEISERVARAERAAAPVSGDDRAAVSRAIGSVLFNVLNFPEAAQARLLGQDMGPLNEKLTDAVLASRSPAVQVDAATVLEEAADEFEARLPDGTGNGRAYNSYAVARMLRARAAALRSPAGEPQ